MARFSPDELRCVNREVFLAMGVDSEGAAWMADTLVRANLQGHDSHGVIRIPQYYTSWRNGEVDPAARPRVVVRGTATALLDGRRGFGQIVAREAMALCLDMTGNVGLAAVGVYNCHHIGRLADYAEMAAARDMAAFVFVNGGGGGQWVAPWGGRAPRLSTNPLAFACPSGSGVPVSLDISTAVVPEGVVRIKRNRREQVPAGWLIDAEGQPATDPNVLYAEPCGALLPFGSHKGYGLALMVEVLAGVLSRAGYAREHAEAVGNGVFMMALDIARFVPVEEFRAHVGALIRYVKGSPPAPGFLQVLMPGEPEMLAERERAASGIFVDEETWSQIVAVARELGVPV